MVLADAERGRGLLLVAHIETPQQLVDRDIEEVQLASGANRRCGRPELLALATRPHTKVEHHIHAKLERAHREVEQQLLNLWSIIFVLGHGHIVAEDAQQPLVRGQTQRAVLALDLAGEGGLAGAGQAAGEVEGGHRCAVYESPQPLTPGRHDPRLPLGGQKLAGEFNRTFYAEPVRGQLLQPFVKSPQWRSSIADWRLFVVHRDDDARIKCVHDVIDFGELQ